MGPAYTSAFVLIGKDVDVKMTHIMRSQLDQHIDKAERNVTEDTNTDPLNPPEVTPTGINMLLKTKRTGYGMIL